MNPYGFHPEARVDLDEIWEFIRADNLAAADRVTAESSPQYAIWLPFLVKGTAARTSHHALCASF